MYQYIVNLVKVVDGDTIDVEVNLGFHIKQEMRLRLNSVNTPELRGKEKEKGKLAKRFVKNSLESAYVIGVKTHKIGKYGRFVADVFFSKRKINKENVFQNKYSLNKLLIKERHAVKY